MIEAGLPMVIISSLGNNKPALSFRLSSMDNILAVTTLVRELENQYNKMFGVGIEIASVIPKI